MKIPSILLQGAALFSCAAAHDAFVWTVDSGTVKHAANQVSSISSLTASSILARRRSLDGNRYLRTADESVLSEINEFGGYQAPLFGAGGDEIPEKFLIRISGFDGTVSEFPSLPDLWIEDATKDLLDDFKARKDVDGICEYDLQIPTKPGIEIIYSYYSPKDTCLPASAVRNRPSVLTVYSTVPTAKDAGKGLNTLLRILSHLSATAKVESTILILPSASKLKKAPLSRRETVVEEPLDLPSSAPTTSTPAVSAANTSRPLPHNVPQCFTSQDACTNTTNSCSGHGSCYKAHTGCFKCKCVNTVVREYDNGGKKSVAWGGNACEKKDISVPFILFASFGVLMAALVAGGIGMLYSMGAQELPSVLGAGVAGPRAQK